MFIIFQFNHLTSLHALPDSLAANHLQPLQPIARLIIHVFSRDNVFFIIPNSDLGALKPRELPREIFVDEGNILPLDPAAPKKRGRPTKRDRAKKARLAIDDLDRWIKDTATLSTSPSTSTLVLPPTSDSIADDPLLSTLQRYHDEKTQILNSIDNQSEPTTLSSHIGTVVNKANKFVLERLKAAEGLFTLDRVLVNSSERAGVARVERAVNELGNLTPLGRNGGALSLLEGAGELQS
ncbi:hypothetical protein H0H81_000972 [Sphagnurus paluster]|uniref:Uncharacterized protein n=1 Tax=Sphagnurus paluster TaxID=117069 RepID=A0A9P7GTV9_9AGAR|nr:hypothetical protein H0H81_000972 [Sphagnurus paluster]